MSWQPTTKVFCGLAFAQLIPKTDNQINHQRVLCMLNITLLQIHDVF